MTETMPMLPSDHIDLLVTAAARWKVLAGPTTDAFTSEHSSLVVADVPDAGRALRDANLAAVHHLAVQGHGPAATRSSAYVFHEVDDLDPVEVIKACHAYEHVTQDHPRWEASTARRLVRAITTAATHRLDGYSDAPWIWTRPHVRSGPPIGMSRGWRPDLSGVAWVDVEGLERDWPTASLVIVTADAAADIPAWLPRRSGLIVIAERAPGDSVWEEVMTLAPEVVVFWPTCVAWLEEQLRRPTAQFTQYRPQQP